MNFEYKEEYQYFTNVCLNLTDDCNLACVYCFVQQKPHYMELQTAKDAVDFVINNCKKAAELRHIDSPEPAHVTFFGGEPTLMWDKIIVPLVDYVETEYEPGAVEFTITTNGTLLNKERIQFLKEHHIFPLLSIDGSEKVQNLNRPCRNGQPSFPLVEKNIPLLLEAFPYTTFRATINQNSCEYVYDSYLYAMTKGFSSIFFCPNAREEWSEENIQKLQEEVNKMYTYFIMSFMNNLKPIECIPITRAFRKILSHDLQVFSGKYDDVCISRYPVRCGLGSGSASIAYDGKIFGCQEQDSRDTSDYFYIGDIYNGINKEKHSIMLKDYSEKYEVKCEKPEKCDSCKLRCVCAYDCCPSVSHDRFNSFQVRPYIDCVWEEMLINGAITAMHILVNENNQLFKEYLDNCL